MKQFFRLLFISFGLLLLLGMDSGHSHDISSNSPETTITSSFDFQAGIIPASSTDASQPITISQWSLIPEGFCTTIHQIESIKASLIRARLLFFEERFMDYSPAIPMKKGVHIFQAAQKGEIYPA